MCKSYLAKCFIVCNFMLLFGCGGGGGSGGGSVSPVTPDDPTKDEYLIQLDEAHFKHIPTGDMSKGNKSIIEFHNNSSEAVILNNSQILSNNDEIKPIDQADSNSCKTGTSIDANSYCTIKVIYNPQYPSNGVFKVIFDITNSRQQQLTVNRSQDYSSYTPTTIDGVKLDVVNKYALTNVSIGDSKSVDVYFNNQSKYSVSNINLKMEPAPIDIKFDTTSNNCSNGVGSYESCFYGKLTYNPKTDFQKGQFNLTGDFQATDANNELSINPVTILYSSAPPAPPEIEVDNADFTYIPIYTSRRFTVVINNKSNDIISDINLNINKVPGFTLTGNNCPPVVEPYKTCTYGTLEYVATTDKPSDLVLGGSYKAITNNHLITNNHFATKDFAGSADYAEKKNGNFNIITDQDVLIVSGHPDNCNLPTQSNYVYKYITFTNDTGTTLTNIRFNTLGLSPNYITKTAFNILDDNLDKDSGSTYRWPGTTIPFFFLLDPDGSQASDKCTGHTLSNGDSCKFPLLFYPCQAMKDYENGKPQFYFGSGYFTLKLFADTDITAYELSVKVRYILGNSNINTGI
jgi:hypothetical protein